MNHITLYLSDNYTTKEGKKSICLRVRIGNKYVKAATDFFIKPLDWDAKNQRVKKSVKNAEDMNMILEQKKGIANDIFVKYRLGKRELTSQLFKSEFKNPTPSIDFYTFVEQEIDARKRRLTDGSLRRERSLLNILKGFKSDLTFSELTEDFVFKFYDHLCDKGNGGEYRNMILRKLGFYIRIAIRRDFLKTNPIKIKQKKYKKAPVFIDESEVKTLIELYKSEKLPYSFQKVLRWYLFTCLGGGMRISDLKRITFEQIIDNKYLVFSPKKLENVDNKTIQFELPEPAKKLIKDEGKFAGTVFNMYKTDQITNRIIKKVFALAGIKRKKISWHSSRHTFAVLYLTKANNAMAFPTLSKIMGHSTIKMTMDTYVGVTSLLLDEGMRNLNVFKI